MVFFGIVEIDPEGRLERSGRRDRKGIKRGDRGRDERGREREREGGWKCRVVQGGDANARGLCASYPEDEADRASSGRELRHSRGKGVSLFKERSR